MRGSKDDSRPVKGVAARAGVGARGVLRSEPEQAGQRCVCVALAECGTRDGAAKRRPGNQEPPADELTRGGVSALGRAG